ncbi:MAG: hypothetical protein WC979_09570 [Candidatus Pacearchaeota archaeon]|jgi:hypothetical protein
MKYKLSFWLILIGLIIGIGYSLWITFGLFQSQNILSSTSLISSQANYNLELYTQVAMISSWISVIAGILLSVFVGINLFKNKKPTKRNFKFIIILSAIGFITSIFYGAVLMLIGGILGYNSR